MPSLITNLTNFADQLVSLQLDDGSPMSVELIYQGATERWQINVSYPTLNFLANGLSLCCYPNVLRQWGNILPFGIACVTSDQTDPFDINDFSSGRVQLYLLNQSDISEITSVVFEGSQV